MSIRLIWDKSSCAARIGAIAIYSAPREHPPFDCQAMVVEQDTNLILGEQTTLVEPNKPAWYLANTLERDQPVYKPGDVIIKRGPPMQLLAVIHDIEQQPSCDNDSLKLAWQNLMTIVTQNNIKTLATPALGSVYGKIKLEESLRLLGQAIHDYTPPCLEKIWLILPAHQQIDLAAVLN
jgi:hypothetical protein